MAIEIIDYQPDWPARFERIGRVLRAALESRARAIHHIGSTSVPGLVAKDIIDIQITVADFDPALAGLLEGCGLGLTWRRDIVHDHLPPGMELAADELAKRLASRAIGAGGAGQATNIHIRIDGKFNQRYPLLCRDYLRCHPDAASAYGVIKQQLARYFPDNKEAYYDIKDPVFDIIMAGARDWARVTGWRPAASDA